MFQSISYEECLQLTPLDMAKRSQVVLKHQSYLEEQLNSITSESLRSKIGPMLFEPYPAFLELYGGQAGLKELEQALAEAGFYDFKHSEKVGVSLMPPLVRREEAQSFLESSGSGMNSHHNFPGGLAVHVSVNLKLALAAQQICEESYGYDLKRNMIVAAQLLHDCQKPYVLQWQNNGTIRPQVNLARTGSHHIFGLAESIYQKLPAAVVVTQACAHNHVVTQYDENFIVEWLKCAAFLAQVDPIEYGLLEEDGKTLPLPRWQEYGLTHLGDHTWVVTLPATQWINPLMEEILQEEYDLSSREPESAAYYALRNYVYSQATTLYLHQLYVKEGAKGVAYFVRSLVTK